MGKNDLGVLQTADECLSVRETTIATLKTRIHPYTQGTKFVYRMEEWYYPEYDKAGWPDPIGRSGRWYVGATNEQVPRWMYCLLLDANFHKGNAHNLKELFELNYKETL